MILRSSTRRKPTTPRSAMPERPAPEECGAPGIAGPCILPAGHDESFHADAAGKYWLVEATSPSLLQGSPTAGSNPHAELCGASTRIRHGAMPFIGPCILRYRHDGPVHQDADGSQWTDPQPAADAAPLCPPAGDLRDRLIDAIRRAPEDDDPPNELIRSVHPTMDEDFEVISGPPDDFADAVLPVTLAWAAEQTQRAETAERAARVFCDQRDEARSDAVSAWQNAEDWHEVAQAKEQRTDHADRERDSLLTDLTEAERTIAGIRHACRVAVQPPENPRVVDFARRILADLDQPAASRTAPDGLVQRLAGAEAAVQRVRKVHRPGTDWSWRDFGCTHEGTHQQLCAACRTCYPCPTITALDQPEDS